MFVEYGFDFCWKYVYVVDFEYFFVVVQVVYVFLFVDVVDVVGVKLVVVQGLCGGVWFVLVVFEQCWCVYVEFVFGVDWYQFVCVEIVDFEVGVWYWQIYENWL